MSTVLHFHHSLTSSRRFCMHACALNAPRKSCVVAAAASVPHRSGGRARARAATVDGRASAAEWWESRTACDLTVSEDQENDGGLRWRMTGAHGSTWFRL